MINVSRDYRVVWQTVWLCAALLAAYAAPFIWRSSFVVEGERVFCLFDDALISMRYAENWARGLGPVWNAGERVEGYTSPLWTAVLAVVHLLPLSKSGLCLLVQIIGVVPLWACLIGTARLARKSGLRPAGAVCAVVLVALHYNLIYFSLMGMETAVVCALMTFGLCVSVRAIRRRQGAWSSAAWYAPAVLTRFDALPVVALALALEFLSARRGRIRTVVSGGLIAIVIAAHFIWRHSFYGDWWPNTYYLKMTGWPLADRMAMGLRQGAWIALNLGIPTLLAGVVLLRPKRHHLLLAAAFAGTVAYHVYVGGDAWPLNRFVIPTTCGLFVLAGEGMDRIARACFATVTRAKAVAVCGGLVLVCAAGLISKNWRYVLLASPPQLVPENTHNFRLCRAVEKVSDPDALLAVRSAGVVPYFSGRPCHDLLGKCDAHIARLPAHLDMPRPGHNKYDTEWSLREFRPDIVLDAFMHGVWEGYHPVRVEVDGREVTFFVRDGSPRVHGGTALSRAEAEKLHRERYAKP